MVADDNGGLTLAESLISAAASSKMRRNLNRPPVRRRGPQDAV